MVNRNGKSWLNHAPDKSTGKCRFCTTSSKWWSTEKPVADEGQSDATGIFLRLPKPTIQTKKVSATMAVTGGSSRSRSSSKGASIFVLTASTKPAKALARPSSDGITLGTVAKRILAGFGSEPMKPSHSSVTTKLMRISGLFETNSLQRFIMGLMWPRPG